MTMGSSKTWQIVGLALGYPTPEFASAVPELVHVLERERLLRPEALARVARWLEQEAGRPLLDAEERYAATFDGGRFLSLHLFEHVHGDGKERGRALSQLSQRYAELGMALDARETPDYLPALCELATACGEAGLAVLTEALPVVELLGRALVERQSPYAVLVQALVEALGAQSPVAHCDFDDSALPTVDLEALDRDWVEAPVEFGVAAAHDALVPLRRSKHSPSTLVDSS
jgi:nitrate reductase delta subunit